MDKKFISIVELSLIVISVFSFAYFVSTDLPEILSSENSFIKYLSRPMFQSVSALGDFPSGCCKETLDGATCQDVLVVDKSICKTDLIGTSCQVVSECQRGCCYDSDSGICSLNSPKESCTTNGGKWSDSETCNIPECQVGCCLVGTGAIISTTRECANLATSFNFNKNFQPLDNKGSCDAYTEPKEEGACLTKSDDFSDEKNCVFTTKENCNRDGQEFKKGYLCSSKELNTNCKPTTKTTCYNDKVYFLDSCGNKANIFNSAKTTNQSYWEKIILPKDSCVGSPETCGNCDYSDGSVCTKFISGKDMAKPKSGDYVCRNLDCSNGRKHGESWCISDTSNAAKVGSAVGTRNYVATCFEGEIRLEGCADFNQEICIENKDSSTGKTDAMCVTNDWRSCIYANDASSYIEVKKRCEELPQCIMFNDISGNERYKNLPGFKEISNEDQGRAGKVGEGMNDVITHCVPRFTPGYQFWNSASSVSFDGKTSSENSYGGSVSETSSLCDLGSFTCVSHIETTSSIAGGSSSTDKQNPECNWQAVDSSKQKVALMMDGLNNRCRMLGSCGMQYNTQGDLGRSGFSVNRVYIDKKGKSHLGYTTEGYNITIEYLKNLKNSQMSNKFGTINTLYDLNKYKNGASLLMDFGSSIDNAGSMISDAFSGKTPKGGGSSDPTALVGAVGALAGLGMAIVPKTAAIAGMYAPGNIGISSGFSIFSTIAVAAAAFTIGSLIGGMMSSGQPPGKAAVTTAAWAGGVTAVTMTTFAVVSGLQMMAGGASLSGAILGGATAAASASGGGSAVFTTICMFPILCLAIAIAAVVYVLFTEGTDHEYYITEFKCEPWQPPLVGKCEECNNDVRPCTEFKCRSLGNNCQYFIENGEPGYCATMTDIWQAKIEPWNEVLTEGNKYTNVSSFGFEIKNNINADGKVDAWKPVSFGIITDKDAICKIDTDHSKKFEEMRYVMATEENYDIGKIDNRHHKIVLSPHALSVNTREDISTTLPLEEGDNEYYIVCQNFAGTVNDAPFIVKIKQEDGYDLTPPLITRIAPENNGYLMKGKTTLELFLYINEPAECRYSFEPIQKTPRQNDVVDISTLEGTSDVNENVNINDGTIPFTCITDPSMSYYGEWLCMAIVNNYTSNKKIYIECKDQPEIVEHGLKVRNSVRLEYSAQECEMGLEIKSIKPTGNIETISGASVNLEVETVGCINGGDAYCSFRLPDYGSSFVEMFVSGNKKHSQPLTSLGTGERYVEVECMDKAFNLATANTTFNVFVDSDAPKITRVFLSGNDFIIKTDEESECLFTTNKTIGCEFGFDNAKGEYVIDHKMSMDGRSSDEYYIRCRDAKGNAPGSCTTILKLADILPKK